MPYYPPILPPSPNLVALAGNATQGLWAPPANVARVLGVVSNGGLSVTNGDGGAGAPTFDVNRAWDVILEDQKASGTAGGTSVATASTTSVLNNKVRDPNGLCTLASNQFTLAAGVYSITAFKELTGSSSGRISLFNVTASAELVGGLNIYSNNVTVPSSGHMVLNGVFTVAASQALEIRYYADAARATDGLGAAVSSGAVERYCQVLLRKVPA